MTEIHEHKMIVGSHNLTVYQWGDLSSFSTLVFLNGLFHGHDAWKKQMRDAALSGKYRCICIDYRDCGRSVAETDAPESYTRKNIAEDILAILNQLQIQKFAVIGNSIGGQIGIILHTLAPMRCTHLIMLNSSIRDDWHAKKLVHGFKTLLATEVSHSTIFSMIYPWFFGPSYLEKLQDLESGILDNYCEYNKNTKGLLRFLGAFQNSQGLQDYCKCVQCPTLVISSELDYIFPTSSQQHLKDSIAGSSLKTIPRTGHSSMIEAYSIVNRFMAEWLENPELNYVS